MNDVSILLEHLPNRITHYIHQNIPLNTLNEVIMDLGKPPEIRVEGSDYRVLNLDIITAEDIQAVVSKVGAFTSDNRAGISRTLHRVSAIRNRSGQIIGLTCRVGRAIEGVIEILQDLIQSNQNILFLGRPGIGKTTLLRETARVLSDDIKKRVIVVDTSNEIGGDSDIPHPGIGNSRRMQVPTPNRQHDVMIEAVENHMPEVIIIDEIGTELEAKAARTIAERGVQLVATAHGHQLENLIKNPTLSDLIGGVQSVVLGDEEAKFRGSQKTVLERRAKPTFDILIEIHTKDTFAVYPDISAAVDAELRFEHITPNIRHRQSKSGHRVPEPKIAQPKSEKTSQKPKNPHLKWVNIFPISINRGYLTQAISSLDIPAEIAPTISDADLMLTTESQMKSAAKVNQMIKQRAIPLHVLERNTLSQITRFLTGYFKLTFDDESKEKLAVQEATAACKKVKAEGKLIELSPRNDYFRRLQHQVATSQDLNSISVGESPNRRVRIYPKSA